MKKIYMTPSIETVSLNIEATILAGSTFDVDTSDENAVTDDWSNKKQSHPIWGE